MMDLIMAVLDVQDDVPMEIGFVKDVAINGRYKKLKKTLFQ
jgi:hypothetical protein